MFGKQIAVPISASNPAFKEGGDLRRCDQRTPLDHSLTLASDPSRALLSVMMWSGICVIRTGWVVSTSCIWKVAGGSSRGA